MTHFLVLFTFLSSFSLSVGYVFDFNPKYYFMICPPNSSFINPIFFPLQAMVYLIHNVSIKSCLNIFCNVLINICFFVYSETVYIHITRICFLSMFWFYVIIKNSYITTLPNSNIDKPK